MGRVDERNDRVTEILNSFFEQATNEEFEIDEALYSEHLDNLFTTKCSTISERNPQKHFSRSLRYSSA